MEGLRDGAVVGVDGIARDAWLSGCGRYRYCLWRSWVDLAAPGAGNPAGAGTLAWVMLNPSTADHREDDATIRKCMGFARRFGYTGIAVYNLFNFRTPSPVEMKLAGEPVGPDGDAAIKLLAGASYSRVVAAWGAYGGWMGRDLAVLEMLRGRVDLRCLGVTKHGHPRHPLYVSYDTCSVAFPVGRE